MNGKEKNTGEKKKRNDFSRMGEGKTSMLYKRHVSTIGEKEREIERRKRAVSLSISPPLLRHMMPPSYFLG